MKMKIQAIAASLSLVAGMAVAAESPVPELSVEQFNSELNAFRDLNATLPLVTALATGAVRANSSFLATRLITVYADGVTSVPATLEAAAVGDLAAEDAGSVLQADAEKSVNETVSYLQLVAERPEDTVAAYQDFALGHSLTNPAAAPGWTMGMLGMSANFGRMMAPDLPAEVPEAPLAVNEILNLSGNAGGEMSDLSTWELPAPEAAQLGVPSTADLPELGGIANAGQLNALDDLGSTDLGAGLVDTDGLLSGDPLHTAGGVLNTVNNVTVALPVGLPSR